MEDDKWMKIFDEIKDAYKNVNVDDTWSRTYADGDVVYTKNEVETSGNISTEEITDMLQNLVNEMTNLQEAINDKPETKKISKGTFLVTNHVNKG